MDLSQIDPGLLDFFNRMFIPGTALSAFLGIMVGCKIGGKNVALMIAALRGRVCPNCGGE